MDFYSAYSFIKPESYTDSLLEFKLTKATSISRNTIWILNVETDNWNFMALGLEEGFSHISDPTISGRERVIAK